MITTNGTDIFESGCELMDVTSLHRPDPGWLAIDSHSHRHRWHADGAIATSYSPSKKYETPSLIWIQDGVEYFDDGVSLPYGHHDEHRRQGVSCHSVRRMIVNARLIKRTTADGLMEMMDEIPLGKIYRIDVATRRVFPFMFLATGQAHEKEMVQIYPHQPGMWLPVELLEFLGAP